ncbi:MAG: alanine racemase [Blautia sp.]|nr:alanine racemase [Blautia sp.]
MEHKRIKAVISLDHVVHNFEEMHRNIDPRTKIVAVIKADGYGHGAVPIARRIEGLSYIWGFAVAIPEEAIELRGAGIEKPILILGPVFDEYYEEMAKLDVRLAIMDYERAEAYAKAGERVGKPVKVHLALDTGMTRIGFADTEESIPAICRIASIDNLTIEGMFTHFARADETDRSPAMVQLERYLSFVERLETAGVHIPLKHCCNSAGIIRVPEGNLDLVRAGITIYGIYPSGEVEKDIVRLKPVMELISHVSYAKTVAAGVAISYGGTYVTDRKMRVATIPVGYADGYPRLLSNRGWVLIHGKKAPILGRVCMDQFMVDVTDIENVEIGSRVVLMGRDGDEEITADTLGDLSGRFSYELVCDIGKRVPRVYTGS